MPGKEKSGLVYGRDFISSTTMSEKDQLMWRLRAVRGDVFEVPGAYGDSVFVPKTISDVDPGRSREMNNLKLEQIQKLIDWNKKNNPRGYGVG